MNPPTFPSIHYSKNVHHRFERGRIAYQNKVRIFALDLFKIFESILIYYTIKTHFCYLRIYSCKLAFGQKSTQKWLLQNFLCLRKACSFQCQKQAAEGPANLTLQRLAKTENRFFFSLFVFFFFFTFCGLSLKSVLVKGKCWSFSEMERNKERYMHEA